MVTLVAVVLMEIARIKAVIAVIFIGPLYMMVNISHSLSKESRRRILAIS